ASTSHPEPTALRVRPRRALAVAEPSAIRLHALPLVVRRMARARRELVASGRRTPAELGTVVRVVGRLERIRPRDEIGQRELLRRPVGALVRKCELVAGEKALSLGVETHA